MHSGNLEEVGEALVGHCDQFATTFVEKIDHFRVDLDSGLLVQNLDVYGMLSCPALWDLFSPVSTEDRAGLTIGGAWCTWLT